MTDVGSVLVLLVALAQDACAGGERFGFAVKELRDGEVDGLEVRVDTVGASGVDTVRGGRIRVCLVGGKAGDSAEISLPARTRAFHVLFPLGPIPLGRGWSPTIVVCRVKRDCPLLTLEEARRLVQQAKPAVVQATLTAREKEAFFAGWKKRLEEQGMRNGPLVEELRRKERQVAAARAASELLSRFTNRAREIVDRFRRYAPDALDHPSSGPFLQINSAIAAYNPVYDDLNEKADSYRKATADSWGRVRSGEFQRLVGEALRIHGRIYELNELGTLITDCRHGWKTCRDRPAARARILDGAGRIAGEVDADLNVFASKQNAFLERLDEQLFD